MQVYEAFKFCDSWFYLLQNTKNIHTLYSCVQMHTSSEWLFKRTVFLQSLTGYFIFIGPVWFLEERPNPETI